MNISGFTNESLKAVEHLLYAEGQVNPLEGQCDQKEKRKAQAKPRTPAQQAADQARSQQQKGKPQGSSATRSQAAKKAAETRARCKGGAAPKAPTV